ncbi:hypothetical protein CANINC_004650 [Pichia inconspicua]|uniref:Uncharacterized protein n=1 Tax=Pichia inconspicua TaxID=52247 RepID=A0A4T0WWB9_9ASCO|nr:hypothetical protein CANINC_004650 [[Candida] inconspicua]
MISIKTSTYTTHILQLVLAVIILGLSICTLLESKSLSSVSKAFSDFIIRSHGTELLLSDNRKVIASSIASSLFTLVTTIVNYFFPTVAIKYFHPHKALLFEYQQQKTINYLEIPNTRFVKASIFGLSKTITSYIISLFGSESISDIFWFVNTIISVGNFATTDCKSVPSLLETYNVTGVSTTTALMNFFNIFDNSSHTSDIFEEIYSTLSKTNITLDNFEGITLSDLNGTRLQSDLILKMSSDCNIKKASMAMTIIIWIVHFLSSILVATEVFQFYTKMRSLKIQLSKEETTTETINDSALQHNLDSIAEDNNEETPESEAKIFLVFDRRWGLFNPILKRVSESEMKG